MAVFTHENSNYIHVCNSTIFTSKHDNIIITNTWICVALLLVSHVMTSIMLKALTVTDMTTVNLHTQPEPCYILHVPPSVHTCTQTKSNFKALAPTKETPYCTPTSTAYLPYTQTTYGRLSKMLAKYNIKSVPIPPTKISSYMPPTKDAPGLRTPGIYKIPCWMWQGVHRTERTVHPAPH